MADPKPDDDLDKLMDEMGRLQEQIDACGGWELDRMMDIASDALVLPPDDTPVRQLSGGERRRVALCMALLEKPDLLLLDEPTNHLDAETVQWLEQTLRDYPGTVIIVTHDRYFLDNITKWILELENGRGLPFEGNYSSWLAAEGRAAAGDGEEGDAAAEDAATRAGMDPQVAPGPQAEERGPHQGLRAVGRAARSTPRARRSSRSPRARGWATRCCTFKDVCKGYGVDGEKLNLMEKCSFNLPRGGDRRRDRAQRHRQDDALPHDRRPGAARRRHDRTGARACRFPTSTSIATPWTTTRSVFEEITDGKDTHRAGQPLDELAGLRGAVQFPRARSSRSGWANAPAASGTASTWPRCSAAAATSCSWTSRPTTSTWTRCGSWSRP